MADDFAEKLKAVEERIAAEEQLKTEADVAQQKADGRVNIIPFPRRAAQPFRSELTVERHAIFVSQSYKHDFWRYEKTITHPESGEPVVQRVTVGKVHDKDRARGVLTQEHQATLYRILALWGEQGYPLAESDGKHYGVVTTSAYDLVQAIAGADGANHYKRVRTLLQDLHSIPIVLENGYTWRGVKDLEQFTLLSILQWEERKADADAAAGTPGPGKSEVRIMLSRLVTEGFLRKNVKQLLLGTYEELGGGKQGPQAGIARLLYARLDSELASKDEYHVRLVELGRRLGLAEKRYKSQRAQQFASAIQLLQGKPIHGERHRLRVELRESEEGEDFVLVARREPNQLGLFGES